MTVLLEWVTVLLEYFNLLLQDLAKKLSARGWWPPSPLAAYDESYNAQKANKY